MAESEHHKPFRKELHEEYHNRLHNSILAGAGDNGILCCIIRIFSFGSAVFGGGVMTSAQASLFDEKRTRVSRSRKTQSKDGSVSIIIMDVNLANLLRDISQAEDIPVSKLAERLIRQGLRKEKEDKLAAMTKEELLEYIREKDGDNADKFI